jgi:DNA-binding transcriptional ArsR family regulator
MFKNNVEMKTKTPTLPHPSDGAVYLNPRQLRLVADPLREHIVQSLVDEAKTVAHLAAELGCAPTRLYHHVQRLLEAGLITIEREQPVRGVTEKFYRSAARVMRLDRKAFAAKGGEGLEAIVSYVLDQSRAELEAAARRGRIDPGVDWPDPRHVLAWRSVARVTLGEAEKLRQRVRALYDDMERLARRPAPPEAELLSLALTLIPTDPVSQRVRRVGASRKKATP